MNQMMANGTQTHTLSALVANKPGVLARIAQVFARRGFNIDSLVVSPTRDGNFSRMTMTALGDPSGLDQIIKQVNKLVDVIHCSDLTDQNIVVKELMLIKMRIEAELRTEVLQVAEHFGARSVDLTDESLTMMITGNSDKLDAYVELCKKYNIIELVRTGKVVMARGPKET
ncbi:MAG: acetolactate synthase small subunit [Kiritimatiellae bacterium]|nr:acetolactate synthase small subunit [Kiritimatiellia bacterium]MDD4735816.1 acetolactate synthase small subunit [Kiritimatiellia bacterium]